MRPALAAAASAREGGRMDSEAEERMQQARYGRLSEGCGCQRACATHLVMLFFTLIMAIIWIVRNRAWELVITIEWPK